MCKNKKGKYKKILIFILIITFIIASTCIIFNIIKINKNKTENNIIDNIIKDGKLEGKNSKIMQLKKLQEENKDIVAYIEIEGTDISYPVLQTTNNDYYMDKNYKKEYSYNGSIFLDKDVNLELPSSNFLIYGHNNENGTMFSNLINYKKESYYKEHQKIRFITNKEDSEYEIIAVFLSRVYYKTEKNVFRYYYFINAETKAEFDNYIENSIKASLYNTGKRANYGEQLITLSTCMYHVTDGRLAIVAKKIK